MNPPAGGTFRFGRFDKIEAVDDGACRLLGYSRAELLELHGSDLIAPEERPKVAVSIDLMRRGLLEQRQGRLVRKDGGVVEVAVSARALADGHLMLTVQALQATRSSG